MFEKVITSNSVPLTVINALYRYYEQPENEMTIGELYFLLKAIVLKIEDSLEQQGVDINNLDQNFSSTPKTNH